jgi:hypothetical protein
MKKKMSSKKKRKKQTKRKIIIREVGGEGVVVGEGSGFGAGDGTVCLATKNQMYNVQKIRKHIHNKENHNIRNLDNQYHTHMQSTKK